MELQLKDVTKKYGEKVALDRFSYTFRPGIYGILGANGAGKSTMMNLITDNLRRDGGEITFDGTDIRKLGIEFRRILGYMTQQQGLFEGMTAESFLIYMARLKEIPRKQTLSEIDRVLDAVICKNLLLCNRQCTDFYLLMLPGDKHFKTSVLSKEIGSSRLSFAAPEYMEKFLDITPGSVSVLGLMNDGENHVQLLMDEDVLKGEYIGCHPCINTSSLRFRTADLMEKILPAVHHEPRIVTLPQE